MLVVVKKILLSAYFQHIIWHFGLSSTINLEKCRAPDYPEFGGYGPEQDSYLPGDVIHYFCDPKFYMGGNYRRLCLDSGDWTGDTPVCDEPAAMTESNQSSTAQPQSTNNAFMAIDGDKRTCSKTLGEENGAEWTGVLRDSPREVLRFMLYLPKGPVSYEVFIVRSDGSQASCGRNNRTLEIYDWVFHNCVPPNHTGAVAVKVESLTENPLELCEVVVHTLTDPTCVDPHFNVLNGRLRLTRKTATLVCDKGYTRHPKSPTKLDCIRTGVWTRRDLSCKENRTETIHVQDVPPKEKCMSQPTEAETSAPSDTGTEKTEKETEYPKEISAF